jgi:hypothetical protein
LTTIRISTTRRISTTLRELITTKVNNKVIDYDFVKRKGERCIGDRGRRRRSFLLSFSMGNMANPPQTFTSVAHRSLHRVS